VNTRAEHEYGTSRAFQKLMTVVKRNCKVFIHTSHLPWLPYECNTFVIFDNLESAFETVHLMYDKHAPMTVEAHRVAAAYRIIKRQSCSLSNMAFLCTSLQMCTL
jgi:hypothetical protein